MKTFLLIISLCAIMFISQSTTAQAPSLRAPFAKRVLVQGTNMGVGSGKTFRMANDGGAIPATPRFSEVTTVTYKPSTTTPVPGMVDGDVAVSKWKSPYGLCLNTSGNLIVVEKWNSHRVREINFTTGQVSTIAGDNTAETGASGLVNANGTNARFNQPTDVVMDSNGNLFVSDLGNFCIRKIAPNGDVSTFAGSGVSGNSDGTGADASFTSVFGMAIDANNNIYVTDRSLHRIRKITPQGVVTTIAGSVLGSLDGVGTEAKFNNPAGIDIDATGNLYVADAGGNQLRKITPEGVVTTLAGAGTAGVVDGLGTVATFNQPIGVAVDEYGYVFVADFSGLKLRRVSPTGYVKTVAGQGGGSLVDNVQGLLAYFRGPSDIVYDKNKRCIYMADNSNFTIRKINLTGYFADILPAGFSMNMGVGEVYGTPSTVSSPSDYIFEGYSVNGGSSVTMNIEVVATGTTVYTISSSVIGGNGRITASQEVLSGGNALFTIAPNDGYTIDVLNVNGSPIAVTDNTYTFNNIAANATIDVSFKLTNTSVDKTNENTFKIYPTLIENNKVTIELFSDILSPKIIVSNMLGQIVYSKSHSAVDKKINVQLPILASGFYQVNVDGQGTKRIIIK